MATLELLDWNARKKDLDIKITSENPDMRNEFDYDFHIKIANSSLQTLGLYSDMKNCGLVELVNEVLTTYKIIFPNDRVEKRLKDALSRVKCDLKKASSSKKRAIIKSNSKTISLSRNELINVTLIQDRLKHVDAQRSELAAENLELAKTCSDTEKKLQAVSKICVKMADENSTLQNRLKYFQKEGTVLPNCGKKVGDIISPQHKQEKIMKFRDRVNCALWFAESFGIDLKNLVCEDQYGKEFIVNCKPDATMNAEDSKKIEQLSHLMDRFSASDELYHELSMVVPEMPRSYLLVRHRQDLNRTFQLHRTPHKPGVYVSLYTELKHQASKNMTTKLCVKISADGANMSRIKSYVTFSYQILTSSHHGHDVNNSVDELFTLGIAETAEKYEDLEAALSPLFQEIKDLLCEKQIEMEDGSEVDIEMVLGGDMKFLLVIMGINAANSTFACLWCKIPKSDRYKTCLDIDYYEKPPMARTLTETLKLCSSSNKVNKYGSIHKPLLMFEFRDIFVDELHLMLRIYDVLTTALVEDSRSLEFELNRRINLKADGPLYQLVQAINSCGVAFQIWEKKECKNKYDWTSLTGSMRKLVLDQLPERLNKFMIHEDSLLKTVTLWKSFNELYKYIKSDLPESTQCFKMAKEWVDSFIELGASRIGYQKANVTPYMHILLYHVPNQVARKHNLAQFSGQNVEKLNDVVRKHHLQKSCRWDGTKEAMLACKRIELERKRQRTKRKYVKRNLEYWRSQLKSARGERKRKILAEISNQTL